LNGSVILDAC